MKQQTRFKNKKVLVIGLAISGYHAAMLLKKLGAHVIVNDAANLDVDPNAQKLQEEGIEVVSGSHPLNLVNKSIDFIVKNPGISYDQTQIEKAIKMKIPVLTEVQLAYDVSESTTIGITGTNGKTTTTRMVEQILNKNRSFGKAFAAGNIGIPASEVAQNATKKDEIVFELSSFQLMGIDTFKPHIAVITNIYSAHLDYHGSQEEYIQAKTRITKNQDSSDFLIYNGDQEFLSPLLESSKAQKKVFSRTKELEQGTCIKDNWICFDNEKIMLVSDLAIKGVHNLENVLAAVTVAKIMNHPNESIREALKLFTGVKHRLQFVDEFQERKFYNDSKATNALAATQALNSFTEPVILLAGGLDREEDNHSLLGLFSEKVKALILMGETAGKMAAIGREAQVPLITKASSMHDAIQRAYEISEKGDVILLSPSSASWDQYKNFEDRGDHFISEVNKLIEAKKGGTAFDAGKQ